MVLARGCSDAISRWICLRSPLRSPLTLPFYPSLDFTLLSRILYSWLPFPPLLLLSLPHFGLSHSPRNPPKITYLSTMSLKHRHCLKEPSADVFQLTPTFACHERSRSTSRPEADLEVTALRLSINYLSLLRLACSCFLSVNFQLIIIISGK